MRKTLDPAQGSVRPSSVSSSPSGSGNRREPATADRSTARPAEDVDAVALERGETGEAFVSDPEAVGSRLLDGGVDVAAAVQQDSGAQGEAESTEEALPGEAV